MEVEKRFSPKSRKQNPKEVSDLSFNPYKILEKISLLENLHRRVRIEKLNCMEEDLQDSSSLMQHWWLSSHNLMFIGALCD